MRKSKKAKAAAEAGRTIDSRTEQVLREAFEPTSSDTQPAQVRTEPALEAGQDKVAAEPLVPATRPGQSRRAKRTTLPPVTVPQSHFHQKPKANGWLAEREGARPEDPIARLRQQMIDLPMKAGVGEVEDNLTEVAISTLHYYQYGLSQPEGEPLPVGITDGAADSPQEDASILAGYLDLEKRLNRVHPGLQSTEAAALLIRALASRALTVETAGDEEFVRQTVNECLRVDAPGIVQPEPEPNRPTAEAAGAQPVRLVYRRPGRF